MSDIRLERISKSWGPTPAVDGVSFTVQGRRVHGPARPVRQRQVDRPAPDRRPRGRDRGPHLHRRQGRHRSAAGRARDRDGVPVLRAVPASRRGGEHPVRAQGARRRRGRARGAPQARRRPAGPVGPARAQAVAAFRRAAPARGARPRHRRRDAHLPDGRADVEPRCAAPRRDAPRDPRAAAAPRHDDDLRHARPDRGDDDGRPDRAAEGRPYRTGCAAARAVRNRRPAPSSRASSVRRR